MLRDLFNFLFPFRLRAAVPMWGFLKGLLSYRPFPLLKLLNRGSFLGRPPLFKAQGLQLILFCSSTRDIDHDDALFNFHALLVLLYSSCSWLPAPAPATRPINNPPRDLNQFILFRNFRSFYRPEPSTLVVRVGEFSRLRHTCSIVFVGNVPI